MNPYTNYTLDFSGRHPRIHHISIVCYHADLLVVLMNGKPVEIPRQDEPDPYGEIAAQWLTIENSGDTCEITIINGDLRFVASRSFSSQGSLLHIGEHSLPNVNLLLNGMDYAQIAHERRYDEPPASSCRGYYTGYVEKYHAMRRS